MDTPLTDSLNRERQRSRWRFHVPFHAGEPLVHGGGLLDKTDKSGFDMDMTELPGLDVLGNPEGVIRESQAAVAELFGARSSFYLINGASCGLMAAMLAAGLSESDTVLVPRNAHRAVIHGLVLTGAIPLWMLPESLPQWGLWGAVQPETVQEALTQNSKIKAVIITSPTYEGISSDIVSIAAMCHKAGVVLIVDEAHGGLHSFSDGFPLAALHAGADLVVHSMHKSGGSLTQTALLHLGLQSSITPEGLQQAVNLLQTTSPSYPLLSNLEMTCAWLDTPQAKTRIKDYVQIIQQLVTQINKNLRSITAMPFQNDRVSSQLYLSSSKMTGEALGTMLEDRYGIAYESVQPKGVLMYLNLGLPAKAFSDLSDALFRIDDVTMAEPDIVFPNTEFSLPEMVMTPRQAYMMLSETTIDAENAKGRVSRDIVAACPPGIPLLIPGERITDFHQEYLEGSLSVVKS